MYNIHIQQKITATEQSASSLISSCSTLFYNPLQKRNTSEHRNPFSNSVVFLDRKVHYQLEQAGIDR